MNSTGIKTVPRDTDNRQNPTLVAVIDPDENSNHNLTAMLQDIPGIEVNSLAQDLDQCIPMLRKWDPGLVILNLYPAVETGLEFAKKILRHFPGVVLFVSAAKADAGTILQAMRIGAREFFVQPVRKEELVLAVRKAVQVRNDKVNPPQVKSKVITVFGTKGGAGTTTVAANTASALARHSGVNVALLDLNFQFGDAALQMSVKNQYSILDMIGLIDQVDARVLRETLSRNPQHITLLSGPSKIEDAEHIDCGHLDQILSLFRHVFEFILIDTNHVLNDITIKALDESDHVLVVAAPDVPTICNTTRCLDLFKKMGYDREKVLLVINRSNRLGEIDNPTMEKMLEYPVFWRLPDHEEAGMAACMNKGIPILKMAPRSKLSESFIRMSEHFNGTTAPPEKKRKKQQKPRFLNKFIS